MTYDFDHAFRPILPAADFTCLAHLRSHARERTAAFRTRFHASTTCRLLGSLSLAASDVHAACPRVGAETSPADPHKPSFYNILRAWGSIASAPHGPFRCAERNGHTLH